MGRHSTISPEVVDKICARIENGESLRQICSDPEMPPRRTVLEWLDNENNLDFRTKYTRARENQADFMDDLILEVAENCTIETFQADKVKIGAYQWRASKLKPKKYGDKLAIGGADDLPAIAQTVDLLDVSKRMAFIMRQAQAQLTEVKKIGHDGE